MTTIAHRFATAFNSGEIDRVLDCFAADAEYHDLFYGRFTGHAGLRQLFERMYREGNHHAWTMTRVVDSPPCTIGEWRFTFTVSDAVPQGTGRTLSFPGVSVFETHARRCHTYREYFDRTAALLAIGITADTVAAITARRPSIEVTTPDEAGRT
ncbi:MAG TPA: nuclear transport factor 2 family protein [Pseudonocardiaceae bacterium]|jgi:ketosteroid isomerase-like protein